MKRYIGLESKSLGGCGWHWPPSLGGRRWPWLPDLGTDSFALGFGICGLTTSAIWRIPIGAI